MDSERWDQNILFYISPNSNLFTLPPSYLFDGNNGDKPCGGLNIFTHLLDDTCFPFASSSSAKGVIIAASVPHLSCYGCFGLSFVTYFLAEMQPLVGDRVFRLPPCSCVGPMFFHIWRSFFLSPAPHLYEKQKLQFSLCTWRLT